MTEHSPVQRHVSDKLRKLIKHERETMRKLVDGIQDNTDPSVLRTSVQEFRAALVGQFSLEEAEDGLFEAIEEAAPHFAANVARRKAEHRKFVAELDELLVRFPDTSSRAEFRRSIADLVQRVQQHDNKENTLLLDSVETDIGGLG